MTPEEINSTAELIKQVLIPKYKLKICCHKQGLPEMCEIIELPFKPENGDIICVHPPKGEEGSRITIPIVGLIYDHHLGHFIMRPDVINEMNRQVHNNGGISQNESADPMEQI